MNDEFFSSLGLANRSQSDLEPSWLAALRSEATTRLQEEGLPTRKTEAWQFTSLRTLLGTSFAASPTPDQAQLDDCQSWAESQLPQDDCTRLYLVNGRPCAIPTPEGIEIQALSTMLSQQPDEVQPYLARHAQSEYFGALNSALFSDGLHVRIGKNSRPDKPLHIVHITAPGSTPTSVYPRLVIVADVNSEVSIIETYLSKPGAQELCTSVTEVCLEDGASINHLRVVEGNDSTSHLGTLAVHQKRDSRYVSRSVVMGGKLVRLEIDAHMSGDGAQCSLEGVYHAVGTEHVAHHTTITHEASHCSSSEEYRGLVDDRAHAVFDGIIIVNRDTKGTSAHQQNHNLLLSDGATVNTKPHLEIDSDDLTASHGATIGALDPEHLFFLRARGIGIEQAETILTFSFVQSILDRIESPEIRQHLLARLISRLPYAGDVMELIK